MASGKIIINDPRILNRPGMAKGARSITVKAQPITTNFDESTIAEGPAKAIAKRIAEVVKKIGEPVGGETLKTRQRHLKAYRQGKAWVQRRYPKHPPKSGEFRKWNFSGTFQKGIKAVSGKGGEWVVQGPRGRANRETSGTGGELETMLDTLRRLVPELARPRKLLRDKGVKKALETSVRKMFKVGKLQ